MQAVYSEAASRLLTQLYKTAKEHAILFIRALKEQRDPYPTLLDIKEEETMEPPFPEIVMSYTVETRLKTYGISAQYTISLSGVNHESLFKEVFRLIEQDSLKSEKTNDVLSYSWREKDGCRYISGEMYSKQV
jgi:hypothetical protein